MGEWELEVDDDIVLILGDLTACEGTGEGEEGEGCHVIQEAGKVISAHILTIKGIQRSLPNVKAI
jgi:hypothetical protein